MLLLREGQKGQAWEPSQNECFSKNLEALDRKILSLFCLKRLTVNKKNRVSNVIAPETEEIMQ
jgi:hypothetical protein